MHDYRIPKAQCDDFAPFPRRLRSTLASAKNKAKPFSPVVSFSTTAKLKEQFDAGLETRADFTIDQPLNRYSNVDHAVWKQLYTRQTALLTGRVCDA